jgi:uncharacterized membrane protein
MTRAASIIVALAGLGIATYLTVVHYAGGTPVCAIAHGCAIVQRSGYATFAGVPVAVLGIAAYAVILATVTRNGDEWRTVSAFVALTGLGFSAWLTYVEVAVLRALCPWCLASALCMAALAVLSVARLIKGGSVAGPALGGPGADSSETAAGGRLPVA